jgi:NAD-dependent dihydropyrimidine dehydrogenase PreA subunit
MKRQVIKIDEELCNGCGECVPNCHEGALQIIDGKARLISDLMCDGLGACIGHCPLGAIEFETREAEAYDEIKVMEIMVPKGKNTVVAHLKHLLDHNEKEYLQQGLDFLNDYPNLPFSLEDTLNEIIAESQPKPIAPKPAFTPIAHQHTHSGGGCPGSQARTIVRPADIVSPASAASVGSELRQWPVQLHLVNPSAGYFQNADVVIAADCVAFAMGDFHSRFLKGKSLAIACPKLDSGMDIYKQKITALVDQSNINTLTVVIMQVPCCGGLLKVAQDAVAAASRKIPLKLAVISVEGDVIEERWV